MSEQIFPRMDLSSVDKNIVLDELSNKKDKYAHLNYYTNMISAKLEFFLLAMESGRKNL